jgi:hypothetical protein
MPEEGHEAGATVGKAREVVRVLGISALITSAPLIALGIQVHGMYIDWHDTRYVRRGETLTLAQADEVKVQLHDARELAKSNASKLDALLIDAARNSMWAAEDRLVLLEKNGAGYEDIRDAEKRVDASRSYYLCLEAGRKDCDPLRGR